MSKFILVLSAFAMIVSVTVCVSHAHASVDNAPSEISLDIDADAPEHNTLGSNSCDMACGGCCVHHAMDTSYGVNNFALIDSNPMRLLSSTLVASDYIYGLKRPPKS